MGYVTKEQLERARQVNVLDYILTYEPNNIRPVGNGYRLKDHESLAISAKGFYWHSHGKGGKTALDYLTDVRGYGLVDAVCLLLSEKPLERSITLNLKPPTARKPVILPLRNNDNKRVTEYLQSRGIDEALILNCIEKGILYESAHKHDCIFLGKDESGKIRYAAIRSTASDFKRDAEGSDKKYGFILLPNDPNSREIAVFESGVDSLSHQSLCKHGDIPQFDGWRLSLGGTSILALEHFLKQHPKVNHCIICIDNDEAGKAAAEKIAKLPNITAARSPPVYGKDWNETLQIIKNQKGAEIMEDVRKDIKFIDSRYNTLFNIKDGENIKITSGYDGEKMIRKCRFIDETHIEVGSNTYHICEFAERMEKAGNKYEPAQKQENKIDILIAQYGENLQNITIPMTEAAIKKLVGGKYEIEPLYVNGCGINGQYGPQVRGAVVRGKTGMAVCGMEKNTLTSLQPYWAQTYKRELSTAEPTKKLTLHDKLEKAKEKAAAYNAANSENSKQKNRNNTELG